MTKLNDLQRLLLNNAAQHQNLNLFPFDDNLDARRAKSAVASLMKSGLAEESETMDPSFAWRSDGKTNYGVRITPMGKVALGLDNEPLPHPAPPPRAVVKVRKAALVLQMLRRAEGSTLEELVHATGWLPHTTRAVLTSLRKKGHQLEKSKRDGLTCYRANGDD